MTALATAAPATTIAVVADEYVPGVSTAGDYVDAVPGAAELGAGIICPCRTRRTPTTFRTAASLKQHFKTRRHIEWLAMLNADKANFYRRCRELEQTVRDQRRIIAELERRKPVVPVMDLLEF